jgi:transcriptional regulator with XRE-family HTH domain
MSFADRIKRERERIGCTQAEAASLLDVSKRTLEMWERGESEPLKVTQEGTLARFKKTKPPTR